jgi:hypothetical protein
MERTFVITITELPEGGFVAKIKGDPRPVYSDDLRVLTARLGSRIKPFDEDEDGYHLPEEITEKSCPEP